MNQTFLDTSFLIALVRKADGLHQAALAVLPRFRSSLITTDLVLTEILDGLAAPPLRAVAIEAVGQLRNDPRVRVVNVTPDLFDEGFALYSSRSDKAWGMTDCISFIVMWREGATDALTAHKHFEQAGFMALLRAAGP